MFVREKDFSKKVSPFLKILKIRSSFRTESFVFLFFFLIGN